MLHSRYANYWYGHHYDPDAQQGGYLVNAERAGSPHYWNPDYRYWPGHPWV